MSLESEMAKTILIERKFKDFENNIQDIRDRLNKMSSSELQRIVDEKSKR